MDPIWYRWLVTPGIHDDLIKVVDDNAQVLSNRDCCSVVFLHISFQPVEAFSLVMTGNPAHRPIFVSGDETVIIIGKVISLYHREL